VDSEEVEELDEELVAEALEEEGPANAAAFFYPGGLCNRTPAGVRKPGQTKVCDIYGGVTAFVDACPCEAFQPSRVFVGDVCSSCDLC
jgi:hypothetical protein